MNAAFGIDTAHSEACQPFSLRSVAESNATTTQANHDFAELL